MLSTLLFVFREQSTKQRLEEDHCGERKYGAVLSCAKEEKCMEGVCAEKREHTGKEWLPVAGKFAKGNSDIAARRYTDKEKL